MKTHPHVIHKGNTFHNVAGNTSTTQHSNDDRALDAVPSGALLQATGENQAINRSRQETEALHTG